MNFEHVTQHPLGHRLVAPLECGVIPVDVAHLQVTLLLAHLLEQGGKVFQVLPGRLVQVDVHPGVDTTIGRRQQVLHLGFDHDSLQPLGVEQLFFGDDLDPLVGITDCLATLRIVFDDPHQLEVIGHLFELGEHATGVRVTGADLADLDPGLLRPGHATGSGDLVRIGSQRQSRRSSTGQKRASIN